jgi:hypothetical protein
MLRAMQVRPMQARGQVSRPPVIRNTFMGVRSSGHAFGSSTGATSPLVTSPWTMGFLGKMSLGAAFGQPLYMHSLRIWENSWNSIRNAAEGSSFCLASLPSPLVAHVQNANADSIVDWPIEQSSVMVPVLYFILFSQILLLAGNHEGVGLPVRQCIEMCRTSLSVLNVCRYQPEYHADSHKNVTSCSVCGETLLGADVRGLQEVLFFLRSFRWLFIMWHNYGACIALVHHGVLVHGLCIIRNRVQVFILVLMFTRILMQAIETRGYNSGLRAAAPDALSSW